MNDDRQLHENNDMTLTQHWRGADKAAVMSWEDKEAEQARPQTSPLRDTQRTSWSRSFASRIFIDFAKIIFVPN